MKKWTLHRIHKWAGLLAGLWLAVLGITGFLLDHRDDWAWLWQSGVSRIIINKSIEDKAAKGTFRLYQVDPHNHSYHVSGGQAGLWWSHNSGKNWQQTRFENTKSIPQVYKALYVIDNGVTILWLATDNGLWRSDDSGRSAKYIVLADVMITSLTQGVNDSQLIGVEDRSRLFTFDTKLLKTSWLNVNPPGIGQLPESIDLSRFIRDLHYGRGVIAAPWSLLWNDIAGIAMLFIPFSGFLFFFFPWLWRKRKQAGVVVGHVYKKSTMRWLFRLHAPTLGLLTAIPIIYLSVTGIFLDHGTELRAWMKTIKVTSNWQTPVYRMQSWDGEIYSALGYPGNPTKLSVGTRLGLFTTNDNGTSWQREKLLGSKSWFIWSLNRFEEKVFLGGMGGPNMIRPAWNVKWIPVKQAGHMPSDVTFFNKNEMWLKNRDGIREGTLKDGFRLINARLPEQGFVPWFYFIDGLHSGLLLHKQWKWMNDLFSIMAIFLVITGLMRWWHKKWI